MWGGHSPMMPIKPTPPPTPLRPQPGPRSVTTCSGCPGYSHVGLSWLPGQGCSTSWALVLQLAPHGCLGLAPEFPYALFLEPLCLPIKSCLLFLDGTNWILGDVSHGEGCAGGHHRCDACDSVHVHCAYVWSLGVQRGFRSPSGSTLTPTCPKAHRFFLQVPVRPGHSWSGGAWPPTATRLS